MRSLALVLAVLCTSIATAQPAVQPHPPLGLEVSLPAAKRMAGADEFIRAGDWDAAIRSLEQLERDFDGQLIAVAPQRYLSVPDIVAATLASLPKPGLAFYRRRVDPALQLQFQEAAARRDRKLMQQIVREGFASSSGDDALDWLAEDALESGDPDAARNWWTFMLPPPPGAERIAPRVLRFPDAQRTPAEICARLVLCSVLAGDRVRAERELQSFTSRFSTARGELAGQTGLLAEILATLLAESANWESGRDRPASEPALSRILWSRPLNDDSLIDWQDHTAADVPFASVSPSVIPVVWEGTVLISEATRVRALSINTGSARWPASEGDNGDLDVEGPPLPTVTPATIGATQHTGQVADGRYYTRLGPLVSVPAERGADVGPSQLICVDLRAEGRPVWSIISDEFSELASARFSGPPLVSGGRLYIAIRRAQPQVESGLACFDAATGTLLWSRRLCTDLAARPVDHHRTDNDVLANGAGLIFQIPGPGVITACDSATGEVRWAVTIPAISQPESDAATCALLYDGGRLFVTAPDINQLLALDACDGRQLWTVPLSGRVHDLLGVSAGRLIAAGDQLWGIDVAEGTAWRFGYDDPEGYRYAAGALHGGRVYWTTRDDLFIVDAATGGLLDTVGLAGQEGLSGGNLVISGDRLLIASDSQLTVLGLPRR